MSKRGGAPPSSSAAASSSSSSAAASASKSAASNKPRSAAVPFVDPVYSSSSNCVPPSVTSDPRFLAGRRLVVSGRAVEGGAVGFFATLVEESRRKYGDASIESAPCYYEYGNALFRAEVKRREEDADADDEDEDENDTKEDSKKPAASAANGVVGGGGGGGGASSSSASSASTSSAVRSAAAEAAERRLASATSKGNGEKNGNAVKPEPKDRGSEESTSSKAGRKGADGTATAMPDSKDDDAEADDVSLALELMENAWSILDQYVSDSSNGSSSSSASANPAKYLDWATSQLPRVLTGLGDVLADLGRRGDAIDAYTRALAHRERTVEDLAKEATQGPSSSSASSGGLALLAARRRLVEANVLIAEELLACPPGEDVVTTETGDVLVRAEERVEYARGYYDKAREALQEAVFLMGKLAAAASSSSGQSERLKTEKEDVCYLATMVMGVGTALAEMDDGNDEGGSEEGRAAKKLKTG